VPSRLDIVLITVDALAAKRLGVSGYARRITPNLDAFARKSVYFEAAFSQGPSTRLSVPAMFTSKWDSLLERVPQSRLPYSLAKTEIQLAETLAATGYDTVAVISDRNFMPSYWPSATRGFSTVDQSVVSSTHNAERVTGRALEALHQSRERPLFLWVHYYDPHSPYHQPKGTIQFGSSHGDIYDAEVLYTDGALGPLLNAVESRPDTLTIITSDHGTVFHPKPQTRKAHYGYDLYTATLHVPLLFHAPFLTPRVWTGVVSTLDIYPTLADLLQIRDLPTLCGESLVPVFLGAPAEASRTTFHQFYLPERAARDGMDPLVKVSARDAQYNLVLNREDGSYELYDWKDDYFETENLVASAEHQDAFARLRRAIATFVHHAHEWHKDVPGGRAVAN
jgi:arylsulfatase A-like enzyme